VHLKLLLDENLSPWAAVQLRAQGVDICHVRDRGLLGATDQEVFQRAFEEDRVLVTLNVGDFEAIAVNYFLHVGIVLIERVDLVRDEQLELLRAVIAAADAHGPLVNEVMYVRADGSFEFAPRAKASQH
jgi:predicted nuclease of predicted toxin-antitoxin system